jgi:regulator of sigma E protease
MNLSIDGILSFIFILGAAVVLHEFGHFIVAKWLGIRVETFSFGFGPRLLGWRYGTTDYRISLLPLGGYVKLGGDESNAPIEGGSATDIPEHERFDLRPRLHKFLVTIAGPVMNILTALAIPLTAGLIAGVPASPNMDIRYVRPGGAAEVAGIKPGDYIASFNGKQNPSWEYVKGEILLSPGQSLPMTVVRNGQPINLTFTPNRVEENGHNVGSINDFQPNFGRQTVSIGSISPNSPASEAGLQPGDKIIAIDDEPMFYREQVTQRIQENKGKPVRLKIERNNQTMEIAATPRPIENVLRLGIGLEDNIPLEKVGLLGAASYAVYSNINIIRLTAKALGQVISGQRAASETVSGPIGILVETDKTLKAAGWEGVLFLLGFLSLNLGIMNLLPIPVLDGGAIFILMIEVVLGWVGLTLSMTVRERIQQVGFVIVMLLMGSVIFNDVTKYVFNWKSNKNQPAATATPSASPK